MDLRLSLSNVRRLSSPTRARSISLSLFQMHDGSAAQLGRDPSLSFKCTAVQQPNSGAIHLSFHKQLLHLNPQLGHLLLSHKDRKLSSSGVAGLRSGCLVTDLMFARDRPP